MNLNTLAKEITKREGKKINLSIAQVKEVLSITLRLLAKLDEDEILDIVYRYKKLKRKKVVS